MDTQEKPIPVSRYFTNLFTEHPEWAEMSDNSPILERYAQDHGLKSAADIEARIRNLLGAAKAKFKAKAGKPAKTRRPRKMAAPINNGHVNGSVKKTYPPDDDNSNLLLALESTMRRIAKEEANRIVVDRLQAAVSVS